MKTLDTAAKELADLLTFLESLKRLRVTGDIGLQRGFSYSCVEDWLLQHGTEMSPPATRTPGDLSRLQSLRKQIRPQIKQCFANCQGAVLSLDEGVTYCEGYVSSVIPIFHAWLMVDGELWDPTLELVLGNAPTVYFGSAFPLNIVRSTILARETYGPLLDNWEQRWPLLRQPWTGGV